MHFQNHHFVAVAALISALGILPGTVAAADPGIKDGEILIGQCAALTGPAEGLGDRHEYGSEGRIRGSQPKGGIHGRQIVLWPTMTATNPTSA